MGLDQELVPLTERAPLPGISVVDVNVAMLATWEHFDGALGSRLISF
jgi:hypothetical protein